MPRRDPLAGALAKLRDFAKTYPLATEDHPWGETAMKVKGKVFVFLSLFKGVFRASLKLPESGPVALGMSFAEPTGYGLGKHGWVTTAFAPGDAIPIDMLREWIDESYRAVAPKSVLAKLEAADVDSKVKQPRTKKRAK